MEPPVIVSGAFDSAAVARGSSGARRPGAKREAHGPSRLAFGTGPTANEQAAATQATRAWLETKPSYDALRKEAARQRIRQRHEDQRQRLRNNTTSPQCSSKQYDAFLDNCANTVEQILQTKFTGADSPRRGTDERSRLTSKFQDPHPIFLCESGSLDSPSSQLSRGSTTEFRGSPRGGSAEAAAAEEPWSEAAAVVAAAAAMVAARQAAAEAADAAEAVAAAVVGSDLQTPATARRPQCAALRSLQTHGKVAVWHTALCLGVSDQTGTERAARAKVAALAKTLHDARASRAAAEVDVRRAIETMWES